MQKRTMVEMQLDFTTGLDARTIHGSPQDSVETIQQAHEAKGVEYIVITIYSLPEEVRERIDYLQMIAEDIVAKVR
jgi:hypothetical protein